MKIKLLFSIICFIAFQYSFAFSDSTVIPQDFKNLVGSWKGSITYLDYTSNKPFTMPSELIVKDFKKANVIICSILYPQEPSANSLDTILISENGRLLSGEIIKHKKKYSKDSLEIVTETYGIDGNDNKPAVIRHTYILSKNNYSFKKEVQFPGQSLWILRNEFKYSRDKPSS